MNTPGLSARRAALPALPAMALLWLLALALLWLLALAPPPAHAAPPEPPAAKLVAEKSQIGFVTRQMGVPVEGSFRRFEATLKLDPRRPEGGSVALSIDTGSASLGLPMADAELPKPTWFDVAHHPRASFESTAIRALGGDRYAVNGRLTLKGITRELVVPVSIAPAEAGRSVATGSLVLHRLDFRVGDNEWTDTSMVGNEVTVNFRLILAAPGTP